MTDIWHFIFEKNFFKQQLLLSHLAKALTSAMASGLRQKLGKTNRHLTLISPKDRDAILWEGWNVAWNPGGENKTHYRD